MVDIREESTTSNDGTHQEPSSSSTDEPTGSANIVVSRHVFVIYGNYVVNRTADERRRSKGAPGGRVHTEWLESNSKTGAVS